MVTNRDAAMDLAYRYFGKTYVWGGQSGQELDCSGLVVEVFLAFDLIKLDMTADGLKRHFLGCEVDYPAKGCLAFWGNGNVVTHVEFIVGEVQGEMMCLGARPGIGVCFRPYGKRGDSQPMGFVDPFKLKGW